MAIDLHDVQNNYPFLTLIKVAKEEYLGIVQNCDEKVLSIYNYEQIPTYQRSVFLEYGKSWWWESNRIIPINIFIGKEFAEFKPFLKTMATKDVTILFGPVTSLDNVAKKRVKRRTLQLVRKVD